MGEGGEQKKKKKRGRIDKTEAETFLIAHVHGPFGMLAEVVNGRDDTVRISFGGILLDCLQHSLFGANR